MRIVCSSMSPLSLKRGHENPISTGPASIFMSHKYLEWWHTPVLSHLSCYFRNYHLGISDSEAALAGRVDLDFLGSMKLSPWGKILELMTVDWLQRNMCVSYCLSHRQRSLEMAQQTSFMYNIPSRNWSSLLGDYCYSYWWLGNFLKWQLFFRYGCSLLLYIIIERHWYCTFNSRKEEGDVYMIQCCKARW